MEDLDEEDEELKRAIALSLQEQKGSSNKNNAYEISTVNPDATANSSEDNSAQASRERTPLSIGSETPSHFTEERLRGSSALPRAGGLLGLDRKAMEEARLARLGSKRKAPDSATLQSQTEQRPVKVSRTENSGRKPTASSLVEIRDGVADSKTQERAINTKAEAIAPVVSKSNAVSGKDPHNKHLQYPSGVVKKTWALGHDRNNDIKIEEVLQKTDLNVAVLSAFQWDMDWLLSKINLARTKLIFVMQAKDQEMKGRYCIRREQQRLKPEHKLLGEHFSRDLITEDTAGMHSVRLCFPSMAGQINCMHSKLMLLFHPHHLRIVVASANLTKYDWGETGIMENSVFLIDLPRLTDERKVPMQTLTPFGQDLLHFLSAMGLQEEARNGVLKFDFANTSHLAFVHTIGGAHSGEASTRTGLPGLSRAVRQLNLQTHNAPEIDFCASSIGSLNDGFLQTVYSAVQGEDGHEAMSGSGGIKDKKKASNASTSSRFAKFSRSLFRIYFPTHETVASSNGGVDHAGTICLSSKWYDAEAFPRDMMRDYKSTRPGLLSHNKILYARSTSSGDNPTPIAWAYVGSANLSESAWGKLVLDRSTKAPKLNCRNWECGVVIKVPPSKIGSVDPSTGIPTIDVFKSHVDVPFEFPGEEYGSGRPWFFRG